MTHELITANQHMTIDGKYKLGAIVSRSVAGTLYETEFADSAGRTRPAVIRIRELDAESPEPAIERWRNAMELSHPNLLRLYAAGTSDLDGAPVEYLVMERADESLAGVLAERALSEEEVRQMLEPAVEALRYLHKKGCALHALKPSKVMAVNDQLKLNIDSALRVADGGSPEEDMGALGNLMLECVGSHDLTAEFAEIVWHCRDADLTQRWTVEQLAQHLRKPEPAVEQPRLEVRQESRQPRRTPLWIFAGLAAIVLVVLLLALVRSKSSAPVSATPPAAPAVVAQDRPRVSQPLPPVQFVQPRPAVAAPQAEGRRGSGWSVIVAAYASRDAAEKRMRTLARKWRNFELHVLELHSERAPYMVVLGENLSEDAAQSLRQRAVTSGLPRDTYIKKLM